jgi:FkbH-like protein
MTASAGRIDRPARTIKCVVWDLDNTLWDGVLLEDPDVVLRPSVVETIRVLDRRGILHSVASRGDESLALRALARFELTELFLVPQINWGSKSASIQVIAAALNLGLDAFAFIDDDGFERAEVGYCLPQVLCVDATDAGGLLTRPELSPGQLTEEARQRRHLYQAAQARQAAEDEFTGPREAFLSTLRMRLQIAPAGSGDLARAEELTVRTNQLNTTGHTYSQAELDAFRTAGDHSLLVARLQDRHGPYGTIGLVLVEHGAGAWTIKLLLMSCRVISRGVGGVMITHLRQQARAAGVRLLADFIPNGRNRQMYVTYKFSGFREIARDGELVRLEADLADVPPFPPYLYVDVATRPEPEEPARGSA